MTDIQRELMRFARVHDWGYDARANEDGSVTVGCDVVHLESGARWREFSDVRTMDELRNWGGY